MSLLDDIKQLATAFTKISYLNTAFHKSMGVKGKGLKLSHGEALSIICNIYGYKTLDALKIAIDSKTFELDAPKIHINHKYHPLNGNVDNDLIDLFTPYVGDEHQATMVSTLASTCYSFMIDDWMFQHVDGAKVTHNAMLLNAFNLQGQWNEEFVYFFLYNEYKRLKQARESEYSPYTNGSGDLKQAYLEFAKKELTRLSGFNFKQLFRCGIFHNCLAIYGNSPENIVSMGTTEQNDLDKLFKGLPIKKNPEKCCMAVNGIVGDYLSVSQDNCFVQYGELFKTALYKNTDRFNQVLERYPVPKRNLKILYPCQTLHEAEQNSLLSNDIDCEQFLLKRNIDPKYQHATDHHFSTGGYLLTKYIFPVTKSQEYWYLLDRVPTELNIDSYEWGMALKVFSKLLKHYIFEYMDCIIPHSNQGFDLDKFIKSLYIDSDGVICMNKETPYYTAKVIDKGHADQITLPMTSEEIYLYLTTRAMSHVILDMIGQRNLYSQIACTQYQYHYLNIINRYIEIDTNSSLRYLKESVAKV